MQQQLKNYLQLTITIYNTNSCKNILYVTQFNKPPDTTVGLLSSIQLHEICLA
jgi:hypothetical protein